MATDPPFNIVKAFDRMLKRKYLTKETSNMSKERDFKVGDEVMYEGSKYTVIRVSSSGKTADIDKGCTRMCVWTNELTHYVESPTVRNQKDFNDAMNEMDQIELDFGELTGEDESWRGIEKPLNSDLYCQCGIPELKTNSAYGNVFQVCTKCKKERV